MGDGELSGTGVETSGAISLRFTKASIKLENPMVEDADFLYFLASAKSYEEAIDTVLYQTAKRLADWLGLPFNDGYRLLSAVCDLKFSQIVNDLVTLRVAVPKSLFADSFPWQQ